MDIIRGDAGFVLHEALCISSVEINYTTHDASDKKIKQLNAIVAWRWHQPSLTLPRVNLTLMFKPSKIFSVRLFLSITEVQ